MCLRCPLRSVCVVFFQHNFYYAICFCGAAVSVCCCVFFGFAGFAGVLLFSRGAGQPVQLGVQPSNVVITKLKIDKDRKSILDRKNRVAGSAFLTSHPFWAFRVSCLRLCSCVLWLCNVCALVVACV